MERAGRYLRKFYPWYADRLGPHEARAPGARHGAHDGPRAGGFGDFAGAATPLAA